MAGAAFDFQKFIDDSKNVLMAPKDFFAAMPKEGGLVDPVIKALIYGLVAGIINFIWGLLGMTILGALGGVGGAAGLIATPIAALIGLFIGGVIVLILSAICGGNKTYEANVRVVAALMVMMPINALFAFTIKINIYLYVIISLLISLYGLWLLLNALVSALGGKDMTAKVICGILAIIVVLSSYSTIKAYRFVSSSAGDIMKGMEDDKAAKEAAEKFQKMMEDLKKESK